ncbi:MAG: sigma-70 family RNA polymerase sigma factor [Planctomycetota bacterium]|jgi:RNA polymerase sigma-70 factor (ECF subfamily)
MSETEEQALIERARAGNEEALRRLFERYRSLVCARVLERLSPGILRKVSVADVLQETYLVAFRRLAEFEDRGPGSFPAWLARIAELKAREVTRKYARTAKRADVAEVSRDARRDTAEFAGSMPTPSQLAIAAELEDAARAALEQLPEHYREVVRLLQEERLTMAEAAARLGRSREAVKKLYVRALSRVAELLDVPYGRRP